uniref:pyrroline-5-carboxylate reductase 1, mitochondrial-like n=1 Tax=Ciona intestinalis TaxID=7719 RepID=UPI00006A4881|nr:pyrroline-5-carboxylate reductase 1, mitochondrial-like [Ciona intestinalis]|eukprot:XP_002131193.1 pyrroline-5-carboxylate reductase 1, mitochondrial-like [Ciona intestinalis]
MNSKGVSILLKAIDMHIGFIGSGNLALYVAKGLVRSGAIRASQIIASTPETKKATVKEIKQLGVKFTKDNKVTVQESKLLVLAVKPKIIPFVLDELHSFITKDHLVVSFAAGVNIASIEKKLQADAKVMRGMTNTCCAVTEGATVYATGKNATDEDCQVVEQIFGRVGTVEEVEEAHIDAVTGLSGSGPAYAFEAIEALSDGAVKMGLPRGLALRLGAQSLIGAGRMLLDTGKHPGELKDAICSPEGATIYALHHLEKGGFRSLLIDAVEASCCRTRELQVQGSEEETDQESIKRSIREGMHLKDFLEQNGILKRESG